MKDIQPLAVRLAEEFRAKLGIDARFVVLEGETVLFGGVERHVFKVSSPFAREAVAKLAESQIPAGEFQILSLPLNVPAEERCAICSSSVAPVVRNATHRSEQVTQFLIGESADVLEKTLGDWLRIRLHHDGYLGWVNRNQTSLVPEEAVGKWHEGRRVAVKEKVVEIHAEPSRASEIVNELLVGTTLPLASRRGRWVSVRLPDGHIGWVESSQAIVNAKATEHATSAEIVRSAKAFLGIPYLWGGRSVKAFDCSGFTQTVFRMHGVELPRDAALQWRCGVDAGDRVEDLIEGDLVFFGPEPARVTHVGIALGQRGEFIHSSGRVMVSSLSPGHPKYEENRARTFLGARRLGTIR